LSNVGFVFRDVNWLESRASYFCCIKLKKRRRLWPTYFYFTWRAIYIQNLVFFL